MLYLAKQNFGLNDRVVMPGEKISSEELASGGDHFEKSAIEVGFVVEDVEPAKEDDAAGDQSPVSGDPVPPVGNEIPAENSGTIDAPAMSLEDLKTPKGGAKAPKA